MRVCKDDPDYQIEEIAEILSNGVGVACILTFYPRSRLWNNCGILAWVMAQRLES